MRRIEGLLAFWRWITAAPAAVPTVTGASRDRRLHGKARIHERRQSRVA